MCAFAFVSQFNQVPGLDELETLFDLVFDNAKQFNMDTSRIYKVSEASPAENDTFKPKQTLVYGYMDNHF